MSDIIYFGYGANKTPGMMEAIVGRVPKSQPAILPDYELLVQESPQVPPVVKTILRDSWSKDEIERFATYAIRPAPKQQVTGTAWHITREERAFVDNWEMNDGLWYHKREVEIWIGQQLVRATTEVIDDPTLRLATPNDPDFLNERGRMLEVARQLRLNP